MGVAVTTDVEFTAAQPTLLFKGRYTIDRLKTNYDISRDGQKFLMIKAPETINQINVVLNWFEELKRLVPTDN